MAHTLLSKTGISEKLLPISLKKHLPELHYPHDTMAIHMSSAKLAVIDDVIGNHLSYGSLW